MMDCLSYVTAGGTTKKPEWTCCSGLKTVLKTNTQCLCEAFRNSAQFGVTFNMTKALALPAVCHVSAPAASNCAVSTGIGAAPGCISGHVRCSFNKHPVALGIMCNSKSEGGWGIKDIYTWNKAAIDKMYGLYLQKGQVLGQVGGCLLHERATVSNWGQ